MRTYVRIGYVELHCHSAFSFLDGASLPDDLVAAALVARLRVPRADRPQHGLGIDGVRRQRAGARSAADPRCGDRSQRRPPSDAARRGRHRLGEPLSTAHPRPRSDAGWSGAPRPTPGRSRRCSRVLERALLPERMRVTRRPHRAGPAALTRGIRDRTGSGSSSSVPICARTVLVTVAWSNSPGDWG